MNSRIMMLVIMILLLIAGNVYVFWHIWNILPFTGIYKWSAIIVLLIPLCCMLYSFIVGLESLSLNTASIIYSVGYSYIFILLYLVLTFILLDIGNVTHIIPKSYTHHSIGGTVGIIGLMLVIFGLSNVKYNNKERIELNLTTQKYLDKPLKAVMLTDLHLGYHNRRKEFERWVDIINSENPDFVLIGGDIIDISIRPLEEENIAEVFRQIKAPIYAILGNHEYYANEPKAEKFYKEAGINLLRDDKVEDFGINIVGRDDHTNSKRKDLARIMDSVNKDKYTILLDHQPHNLKEAEDNGIDFQLSGHTHRGQVWPISWIVDLMYEKSYGYYVKGDTQYYVSSGLGIWGAKFRIGTKSEYVVATINQEK